MDILAPQTVAGFNINVTGTATKLFTLIDTASAGSSSHFGSPDALDITPEDGDIRIVFSAGFVPTATTGYLLKQGCTYFFRRRLLSECRLIATGSTVKCSVAVGNSVHDEVEAVAGGGGGGSGVLANQVQGPAASGAAAVGNPVQMGGVFHATPPTLDDGDVNPVELDQRGNTKTMEVGLVAGENTSANRKMMSRPGTSARITTATTTTVYLGSCVLIRIVVEVALTGTVTVYNNTAGSGTVLTILPIGTPAGSYQFDAAATLGVTVVTSAGDRVVVVAEPN